MADESVIRLSASTAPTGRKGQKYLATGVGLSMRSWESEQAGAPKPASRHDYEVIGYVLSGRAELHIEGQMVLLEPGDSYVVPKDAEHWYTILERFSAVEATHPPAEIHGRDEA